MTDRAKNILIGFFVTGAIAIMIALVLFLKPTLGDGKKILNVRFANISGISVGTRVTFAGKPIGEVVHIQELKNARKEADEIGRIYMYQLTLKLDSSADIYSTDEISIKTTGLMGEKSIAILPKAPLNGQIAQPIANQTVYANSIDALESTFNQVSKVSSRLEAAIHRIDCWFQENQSRLTSTLSSFDGILNLIDQEKLVPAIRESVALLNENMQTIKTSFEDERLLHRFANLAENLDQAANLFNTDGASILRHLNFLSRDIASGSGTIGRLIAGDDFYLRLTSLLNKGETLMNDVNHYGLLFQYNKQWQKGRTRKANFLNALSTPQEFRNYFEGEVDSMTTSLGRLSELIQKADDEGKERIIESDAFKNNFAALLRQVQSLSDSLKLYNEKLIADSKSL